MGRYLANNCVLIEKKRSKQLEERKMELDESMKERQKFEEFRMKLREEKNKAAEKDSWVMKSDGKNDYYICLIHKKEYTHKDSLRAHLRDVHGITSKGKTNGGAYVDVNKRLIRSVTRNEEGRFNCNKCDSTYSRRKNLNDHYRKLHMTDSEARKDERRRLLKIEARKAFDMYIEYDCEKCDATGFNEEGLEEHEKEFHCDKPDNSADHEFE